MTSVNGGSYITQQRVHLLLAGNINTSIEEEPSMSISVWVV